MSKSGFILMLESDLQDREISIYYFNQRNIPVLFLQQSNEVLSLLETRAKDHLPQPKLILLSVNSLPDNGLTVLEAIKKNDNFKHIPVVVLGENTQPDLIKKCYASGANTFINKPFTNKLTDVKIKAFLQYWFDVAEIAVEPRILVS